ncbi:isopentenyl-diphosphate Delta-isomerase 1 [Aricia agestis]|uniref:isopentenyl-diphosphate Delta-isomerase 1 n=1 Tax=Aricia agestis TaxID=91739 RepID=UPI001C202253|nr:isopentenyl-diphosphate Delta-isomerase 1 [Aricia agestis]XP_041969473.1 isopentenyl-diphosphate Delta-isomerase 1 [Aricia agestis]
MLVRSFARSLWSTARVEKRFLASKPAKPEPNSMEDIEAQQAAALDNDICLLVDEKDNMIGTATKRVCHTVGPDGSIPLHRAFSVFLFNKRGDMLLQKRSSQKVTYPDYYTNACCSHPLFIDGKPEDVITAAQRRLNHELGIPMDQLDASQFTYLTRIHYHDPGDGVWGEHELDHILFLQGDFPVKPNSAEISEYCYVPKNEFNAFIPTLEGPMTPWFNMVRRHRLKLWWDNLHRLDELKETDKIHKFISEN